MFPLFLFLPSYIASNHLRRVFTVYSRYNYQSRVRMSASTEIDWATLKWTDLHVRSDELRPANTMVMGQCFNWKSLNTVNKIENLTWVGVVEGRPYAVRQGEDTTFVAELSPAAKRESSRMITERFRSYFQLEENLSVLYSNWAEGCSRMKVITARLPGVRVVRQNPWECLISFICSSNNNIIRITLMLDRLRAKYGCYLCSVVCSNGKVTVTYDQDKASALQTFYPQSPVKLKRKESSKEGVEEEPSETTVIHLFSFPSPAQLSVATEEELRELGMGYRAKFITGTTKFLLEQQAANGLDWLEGLRASSYCNKEVKIKTEQVDSSGTTISEEVIERENRLAVQQALLELPGVGPKVADCVALFSLDQPNIVPVDTHVWSITIRDYAPELKQCKSLTPTVYEAVGDVFRKMFRRHAGWAHSVLFAAELPAFRDQLPEQLVSEMKDFNDELKKEKASAKASKKVKKEKEQVQEK